MDRLEEILTEEDLKHRSRWRKVYVGVVLYTILLVVALYLLSVFSAGAPP